ncbi:hypothetical protein C488_15722 [Natrinema pellirubrum DSM 15624]|uniref:DUF8163 domain-containing protein n=1 Tax=Natrinema pellirubrum (strain DSM 15624 / CIP 106293 / JCM 10476 / NCIMB 786 / 157) TaxID=797303 RepID=L0JTN1_NATP1|nr:hypothetical protein [Natrinema pellirubrum]AGB33756.1 hypothetical protein Natpe_4028 [Natrinema pellirubrum DSM 15624]ELY71985.1 hypothetical protein C488_15722 [Natrinema pellirubrum DSM 15624]
MSVRIDTLPTAVGRDWVRGASLGAIVVAFGIVSGPIGVLAGIAAALVGYLFGTPYAFALGHVALAAVVPTGIDASSAVIIEAAFVAVLLVPLRRTTNPIPLMGVAIASVLAIGGIAWLVVDSQPISLAALTVLGLLAIATYALHRLEVVRLELVPDEDGRGRSPADESISKSAESQPQQRIET